MGLSRQVWPLATYYFQAVLLPQKSDRTDLMSLSSRFCVFRADTESTSEHLEALRKLSSDLVEQRATLEELQDQKHAILPRLSLLDKDLVKQQVRPLEQF